MSTRRTSRPETEISGAQRFLYGTALGRGLLRLLVRPWFSKAAGWYMDRRLSAVHVRRFIRKNRIDMSDYPEESYRSFNSFFTRRVKEGARPFDMSPEALTAPCDGRLSAYHVSHESTYSIKGGSYTLEAMLQSKELAERYEGGLCLIFRLAVDNYHRYHYIDSGSKEDNVFIVGRLHTVHPIALSVCELYKENSREYTVLHTDHFGDVVQIEVGALLVGRICNRHGETEFSRGEEKGCFEYGGSTIVLLLEKGRAQVDEEFFVNTAVGLETAVKAGERIGQAVSPTM